MCYCKYYSRTQRLCFRLKSVKDALGFTTECRCFVPVDLKNAYYRIPIPKNYQKLSETVLKGRMLSIYCLSQCILSSCKSLYKSFDSSISIFQVKRTFAKLLEETFEICFKNIIATDALLLSYWN